MNSFKSRHYPASTNKIAVRQSYAMQYYAVFILIVMIGVVALISSGKDILWFAVVGLLVSALLSNVLAGAQLRRNIAEVFFVEGHFSLISVYEILYGRKNHVFPLGYATPHREEDQFTVTYIDQLVTFSTKDWDDFELIWEQFTSI